MKEFEVEAFSLAFHPSGLHLIVGFSDYIRMLNIFDKDIVCYREIQIKCCKVISFSNGGHLFAVVANSSLI